MPNITKRCWGSLLLGVTVVAGLAAPDRASAQDPTAKPDTGLRVRRNVVTQLLRDQNLPADQQQLFDDYFNKYQLLQLKEGDPLQFRKVMRIYFTTGKSGPAHKRLTELTLDMMQKFVSGNFPPEIKYNAMLMIGELNDEEAGPGNKPPAKPSYKALGFMYKQLTDPKAPDAIKVGALIGIERHAESHAAHPMSSGALKAITRELVGLLTANQPPASRTVDGHAWMRRSAAQILAKFGEVGDKNSVFDALAKVMADDQISASVRCAAAQALGSLKYPAKSNIDFAKLATDYTELAKDICKQELAALKRSPRRLKVALYCIATGLAGTDEKGGLLAAAAPEQKKAVQDARSTLQTLLNYTEQEDFETLAGAVNFQAGSRQGRAGSPPATDDTAASARTASRPASAVPLTQVNSTP